MKKLIAGIVFGVLVGLTVSRAVASRDSSGTYTSPSGSFVSGTTISSSAVNAKFSDIGTELTDSLSRSGKGPMLAPLKATDGSAAAPSLTFSADTDTGFYRIGANNVGLALNGTKYLDFATTGTTFVSPLLVPDGAVGAPGLTTSSDTTSGIYRIGGTGLAMSIAGVQRQLWGLTGMTMTGTLGVSGDFAVNTNKFTVAGASGNTAIAGALDVSGAVTLSAIGSSLSVTSSGNTLSTGALTTSTFAGPVVASNALNRGTITLAAGTGTATVLSGSKCVCTDTTANASVKCAVSSTTLTATGTGTDVITYICL